MNKDKKKSKNSEIKNWPICVMCLERVYDPEVTKSSCNWCLRKKDTGWEYYVSFKEEEKDIFLTQERKLSEKRANEGRIKNSEIKFFSGVERLFEYNGIRYRAPQGCCLRSNEKFFVIDVKTKEGFSERLFPEDFDNNINDMLCEASELSGKEIPPVPKDLIKMSECIRTDRIVDYNYFGSKKIAVVFKIRDKEYFLPFAAKLPRGKFKCLVFKIQLLKKELYFNVHNYESLEETILDVWKTCENITGKD